jgi:hypothetical protein
VLPLRVWELLSDGQKHMQQHAGVLPFGEMLLARAVPIAAQVKLGQAFSYFVSPGFMSHLRNSLEVGEGPREKSAAYLGKTLKATK